MEYALKKVFQQTKGFSKQLDVTVRYISSVGSGCVIRGVGGCMVTKQRIRVWQLKHNQHVLAVRDLLRYWRGLAYKGQVTGHRSQVIGHGCVPSRITAPPLACHPASETHTHTHTGTAGRERRLCCTHTHICTPTHTSTQQHGRSSPADRKSVV